MGKQGPAVFTRGRPFSSIGVAQALLPVTDTWNTSALHTGKSARAT